MVTEDKDEAVFKALASNDRRKILDLLYSCPLTTGEICQQLPWLSRCAVMQHLKVLTKAGLTINKKQGRNNWHYLDINPIQEIYQRWLKPYAAPAANFLFDLKENIENK